jgi:hypothetical protein
MKIKQTTILFLAIALGLAFRVAAQTPQSGEFPRVEAAWTPSAAHVSDEVEKFATKPPRNKKIIVALSGQVSPRLRQELEARGQRAKDRVASGPLK